MALCMHLAFWTNKNPQMMDSLFRQSGLMRPDKWDRRQSGSTYGQITIQKAISMCTDTYSPSVKSQVKQVDVAPQAAVEPVTCEYSEAELEEIIASTEPKRTHFNPFVLLSPQSSDLPLFPIDALPSILRDYVKAVAEHTQTSPDMAAVVGLGLLAVCLQGKYVVEGMPGYIEPLSLYTVLIASPGERKSAVLNCMSKYQFEYEHDYNEAHANEVKQNQLERASIQRKITALQKKEETSPTADYSKQIDSLTARLADMPDLKPKRFFADDCSSEALTSLLAANHGVFSVISSEGNIFDVMAGRYNNKMNIDVWLKGHCGDAIHVDRKTRESESILHPALSAVLTIQPSVLSDIMSNSSMGGRGLLARILYAMPKSRIGTRTFDTLPIPTDVEKAYKSLIYQLMAMELPDEPIRITLDDEARVMLSAYFKQHEQYLVGEGQAIADWASKYIGTILRIAGLLHVVSELSSLSLVINAETMEKAIQIGSYFLAHAQYAYAMMGSDEAVQRAKVVIAKLKKLAVSEIRRKDLHQVCRVKFFKKAEDMMPTLELLEDHGYLRIEQPPYCGVGRPPDLILHINSEAMKL